MFLSITSNREREPLVLRRLSPSECLDPRTHARAWAERYSSDCEEPLVPSFSEAGAHIPSGGADYEVEIRDTLKPGTSCWRSEPFFLLPASEANRAA